MFDNFVKLVTHYMEKHYTREEAIKMARQDLAAMFEAFFIEDCMLGYDADGEEITISMDDYFPDQLFIYSERKKQEERLDKFEAEQKAKAEKDSSNPDALCINCANEYPECDASGDDMKYAPNSDTIVECAKFEKMHDLLVDAKTESESTQ